MSGVPSSSGWGEFGRGWTLTCYLAGGFAQAIRERWVTWEGVAVGLRSHGRRGTDNVEDRVLLSGFGSKSRAGWMEVETCDSLPGLGSVLSRLGTS